MLHGVLLAASIRDGDLATNDRTSRYRGCRVHSATESRPIAPQCIDLGIAGLSDFGFPANLFAQKRKPKRRECRAFLIVLAIAVAAGSRFVIRDLITHRVELRGH